MSFLLNRVRQGITSPTGTGGPLVLASTAYSNAYQTISGAGGVDATEYCYIIEEGLDWEIQRGNWTLSSNQLARNTPIQSSIGGVAGTTKMNLAGAATIRVIADAKEFSLMRGIRSVTGSTDTIVDGDTDSLVVYNRSSAIAVSLAAPSGNSFKSGWIGYYKNINTGVATITATGATIYSNGVSSTVVALNQWDSMILICDGTNYFAIVNRADNMPLAAAQDFNNVIAPGRYYTIDTASTNAPSGSAYWYLQVETYGPTGYTKQTATVLDTAGAATFIRTRVSTTWGSWHRVMFSDSTGLTSAEQSAARSAIGVEKKNYILNSAMMVSQENGTNGGLASGYYPVDNFSVAFAGTSGVYSAAQVASVTPGGSPNRIRFTVTTADASVGAGDIVYLQTKLEGYRVADLKLGTGAAKTVILQFGVKAPAGTYCVVFGNSASNRTYVGEYTIAGGEANTDVVKSVSLTLDTTGTWLTNNGIGLSIIWGLMAGSTFQQAAGSWGTVNAVGSSNQFNLMGTNGNVFELFDVGLYEGTVAPAFIVPDFTTEWYKCMRYWEKSYGYSDPPGSNSVQSAEERIVYTSPLPNGADVGGVRYRVEKRTTPTVTVYGYSGTSGTVSNQAGVDQAASSGFAVGIGTNSCVVRNNSGGSITLNVQVALFQWVVNARL